MIFDPVYTGLAAVDPEFFVPHCDNTSEGIEEYLGSLSTDLLHLSLSPENDKDEESILVDFRVHHFQDLLDLFEESLQDGYYYDPGGVLGLITP